MNFKKLATNRRSAVNFDPDFTLSEAQFLELLEVTRFTPSGYNAQPWKFDLINSAAQLQELYQISYKQDKILNASNIVVVLGDIEFGQHEAFRIVEEWKDYRGFSDEKADSMKASLTKDRESWKKREMTIRNCSLAAMTFMFAAEDQGLVTCPMMGFRPLELKKVRGYPESIIPIMLIAVGKPNAQKEAPQLPRKTAESLWWKPA